MANKSPETINVDREYSTSALVMCLSRLKHDLGKYIGLQSRWLGADASLSQRVSALRKDLLETRRSPEGTWDAVCLWQQFRPLLMGLEPLIDGTQVNLSDDPDVLVIENAMLVLGQMIELLKRDAQTEEDVQRAEKAVLVVSEACRRLVLRSREGVL